MDYHAILKSNKIRNQHFEFLEIFREIFKEEFVVNIVHTKCTDIDIMTYCVLGTQIYVGHEIYVLQKACY